MKLRNATQALAAVILLIATAAAPVPARASDPDDPSGCVPAEQLPRWVELRQKYRGTSSEDRVEALWRKRVEICEAFKSGQMTLQQAHEAFELERQRFLEHWVEDSDESEVRSSG